MNPNDIVLFSARGTIKNRAQRRVARPPLPWGRDAKLFAAPAQTWAAMLALAFVLGCRVNTECLGVYEAPQLTALTSDLSPLNLWFEQNKGRPRAVALVSST